MKKNWKVWIGVLVSLAFIYMAFGNIDWSALWESISSVDLFKASLSMLIVAAMLILRGYRWGLFLKPIETVGLVPLFWSTCIGFGLNNVLPARLGEVGRALSIHRKTRVGFAAGFGSIVVERLYDTFAILFLFVLCLAFMDMNQMAEMFGRSQLEIAAFLGAMSAILLAGVLLLKWQTDRMLWVARFFLPIILPKTWRDKFIDGLRNFISGLTQSTSFSDVLKILAISMGLWAISGYTVWLVVDACHVTLTVPQTVVVLMAMVMAVAIPAAPGYVGTYHLLASKAIVLVTGLPWEQALAIATVIHAANYIPQTALGLAAVAYEGIKVSDLETAKEKLEETKVENKPIEPK
jgi:glycosyltransferase 2 family protein